MAKRQSGARVLRVPTPVRPALRQAWRALCAGLRRVRDWPDPDSPYSPFLTVLVAALFVLIALASR